MSFINLFLCSPNLRTNNRMKGHSTARERKESGHVLGISFLLRYLRTCSSPKGSARPICQIRGPIPYAKVTVRRPRRLRKRRPNAYKSEYISPNIRQSVLDISQDKKGLWSWDSCSTIEPVVEILDHKEEDSLELNDESDSVLPEIFDGHIYENDAYSLDFLFPSRLSRFVPHILETIEEAEAEYPSIRERGESFRRSVRCYCSVCPYYIFLMLPSHCSVYILPKLQIFLFI